MQPHPMTRDGLYFGATSMEESFEGLDKSLIIGEPRKIAYSTFKYRWQSRDGKELFTIYRHHKTDIFEFNELSRAIALSPNGYHTVTTKKRLNDLLAKYGKPFSIYQKKSKWFLWNYRTRETWPWPDDDIVIIAKDGTVAI